MKKILLFAGLILAAAALPAGEKPRLVTPQSLRDWTLAGADKGALSQAAELTLPAGAQLSHSFAADRVVVQFRVQPVFGVAAGDLATLEVGPVALVFAREEAEGRLVLVLGDLLPLALPGSIELADDGSSAGPVEVRLKFERATGAVTLTSHGQTWHYMTKASTSPVEVVLTAGTHDAMAVQELAVQCDGLGEVADVANGASGQAGGDNSTPGVRRKTPATVQIIAGAGGDPGPAGAIAAKPPSPGNGGLGLEIFTPPSVRSGRVDAVRAAVAAVKK